MKNKKPKFIVVTVLIIVILSVLCIFTPLLDTFTSWIGNAVAPVQTGVTNVVAEIKLIFSKWDDTQKLYIENGNLKKQVDELNKKNKEYITYKQENERLKNILELKSELDYLKPVAATVISKDAGNWFNIFSVNKGKNDGIKVNDTVINSKGLIGRVMQTGNNWAKVATVIDRDHSVSGVISRTGDLVQIDGDLSLMKSGLCKITIITEGADVIIGDTVMTSGIGGIYPKGLFIGTITEFKNNNDGTGKYAILKPDVDFQHIFEVVILTQAGEVHE